MANIFEKLLASREICCRLDDSHVSFLFLFLSLLAMHIHFFCGRVPITEVLGNFHHALLYWDWARTAGSRPAFWYRSSPPVWRRRREGQHASLLLLSAYGGSDNDKAR